MHFGAAERNILSLLWSGNTFEYCGESFRIDFSAKPTCSAGEPKTDIYTSAHNVRTNTPLVLKISYKKENADFLENKPSAERASQIWGPSWAALVSRCLCQIEGSFSSRPLIFKSGYGSTNPGSFALGWRFDIVNVQSGDLSSSMCANEDQLFEIYAGSRLGSDKKDAIVNGTRIQNSGVANFIIVNDCISSTQAVIDSLIPIEKYITQHPNIYFACKALNYRSLRDPAKWDGNRPLAVYVDWSVVDNKLHPALKFDSPLATTGNAVANQLVRCLKALRINNTDDINVNNVSNMSYVYSE